MNATHVKNLSAGVGVALLLTFLFVQQRPANSRQHDRFTRNLQLMKQLDSEVTRDVLSSRYDLLSSYDPFVQQLGAMRQIAGELKQIPSFVGTDRRGQIERLIDKHSEVLSKKARLIESFKSRSAILKNSLQYFPALIAEASSSRAGTNHKILQEHLAGLLRDILLYSATRRSDLEGSINAEMDMLARDAEKYPEIAATLSSVRDHATTIRSLKPEVEEITQELIELTTIPSIDAISAAYILEYNRALKLNGMYRLILYLCAVSLLGYGVNRTVSLVRSRVVVEQANQELHRSNSHLLQAKIDLQSTNETIELTVALRTAELEKEIMDRQILEGQLVQAQKLESIGQLAAGIAHEINTPIQYIGDNTRFLGDAFISLRRLTDLFLQFAEEAGSTPELQARATELKDASETEDLDYLLDEIPRAVAQSMEGVTRVAGIVLAMKEFSHPGSTEKELVDINHSIQSTLTVCRNEWKYVAEVETDLDASLPMVLCLGGEMNQVVLNLVVNAAHAIGASNQGNDRRGLIVVSTRHDGKWVEIRIKDNGTGIPAAVQERIFTPFFTTKEVGKGTGQGLCLARTVVVKKHGGTLTFETAEGEGTTFIARLPLSGVMLEKVA